MSTYLDALNFLAENLGMGLTDIIIILTLLGCAIFAAKELRLGLIIAFVLIGGEYVVFYLTGLPSFKALITTVMLVVALTLSLYIPHSKKYGGIV